MELVLVIIGVVGVVTLVVVNGKAESKHRSVMAALVAGERELAVLPITRLQKVKAASYGTSSPAIDADQVRVTSRRLIFQSGTTSVLCVNLEPAPPGEDAPLLGDDHRGRVVIARRDAVVADFDRVNIDVRGIDGKYQVTRVLIQLAEGRRLAALIAGG